MQNCILFAAQASGYNTSFDLMIKCPVEICPTASRSTGHIVMLWQTPMEDSTSKFKAGVKKNYFKRH